VQYPPIRPDGSLLMQVNIKARTHEKVDSIGEGRALSCHAVLIMEKK
jgi:2-C-methyl-D-erythritol 2,4-cyclodiphosphate synthase